MIRLKAWLLAMSLVLFAVPVWAQQQPKLTLSWQDNSNNEDGFKIQRSNDQAGPWDTIFQSVGANVIEYVDLNLNQGTNYCYRVAAFNVKGDSAWDGPACKFTQAQLAVSTAFIDNSSGTVTSNPTGIDCGTTCSAWFDGAAQVTLAAFPATGSVFKGWSGACSGTGPCVVTMDGAKSVTATFEIPAPVPPSGLALEAGIQ